MSLRMSPGLAALLDVDFTNSIDSESGSFLVASTSFCPDKECSDVSFSKKFMQVSSGEFSRRVRRRF